jgi:hypothetical protein
MSLLKRFESKFEKADGCWVWKASTTRGGYGQIGGFKGEKWSMLRAHRISYILYKGPIPDGQLVCHSCDNRLCVNPKHLFLGSHKDNIEDCIIKGRKVLGRNPKHNHLSFNLAQEIRLVKLKNPNLTYKQLGKLFNTSAAQAHRIITNQIWKDVPKGDD